MHRSLVMPRPAEWLATAVDQLAGLRTAGPNWDSYGADHPQPELVDAAQRLLNELARTYDLPRPAVSPTRTGGVLLGWKRGRRELEIEIISGSEGSFVYTDDESGAEFEGGFVLERLDEPKFSEAVSRMCE